MIPAIVIHGGAGDVDMARAQLAQDGARTAVLAGLAVLKKGGSALDAVQAAVRELEDNPEFNAAVGAVLTRDGALELDAAIMDGATLDFGAIAAMSNLRRPIDLARIVLSESQHSLLVGDGAWKFARTRGIAPVADNVMITERAKKRLRAQQQHEGGGTVGACAIDANGNVAAATSTGGMNNQHPGRVGDTPLAGCGTYADNQGGAASATGHGEAIIRVTMCRSVVELLRRGTSAQQAADAAIKELGDRVAGKGGVICVDKAGGLGLAHNTASMAHGFASLETPAPVVGVKR